MKSQSVLLLLVALGCGLVAMFGIQDMLKKQKGPEVELVEVMVATAPIAPGESLNEANTSFKAVDPKDIPEGAVKSRDAVANRGIKVQAHPGDWIVEAKLSAEGDRGAGGLIPPGMRVFTVPVDPTKTHSGLLLPGNRVDVQLNYSSVDSNRRKMETTLTILQYIEVFATDTLHDLGNSNIKDVQSKHVSLLVTPDQAQMLGVAKQKGTFDIVLRSTSDSEELENIEYTGEMLANIGSEINKTSARDVQRQVADVLAGQNSGAADSDDENPEDNEEESFAGLWQSLQEEYNQGEGAETFASTGPVVAEATPVMAIEQPQSTWEMAIYNGQERRSMRVKLSDEYLKQQQEREREDTEATNETEVQDDAAPGQSADAQATQASPISQLIDWLSPTTATAVPNGSHLTL